MIPGFRCESVLVESVQFYVCHSGGGDPLVLLHGFPQTSHAWRKVAPALAESFHVIVPDLPGYGRSAVRNLNDFDFAKRNVARLILKLIRLMGHSAPIRLAGHDRGGRAAYRLALDCPQSVASLAILGLTPTASVALPWSLDRAISAYHWFFLAQPYPLPERLVLQDVEFFVTHTMKSWAGNFGAIETGAVSHYVDAFRDPDVVHAACQDYRAGVTSDVEHDLLDQAQNAKLSMPVLLINPSQNPDAASRRAESWRNIAPELTVQDISCGHFIMEEAPDEATRLLRGFFHAE